jgi:CDGSH-type Zn-finger protein
MTPKDAVLITPYRDGPLLVRGSFTLVDGEGNPIGRGRNPVALCRCGKSSARPFCDGTHKLIGFRAPVSDDSGG